MRQWLRSAGFLAILLAAIATARAQSVAPDSTVVISQSTFGIDDGWRMKAGDDPAWAAADLDDSAWQQVTAPVQTTRVAWYRTRIRIQPGHSPLALMLDPVRSNDVLYVNGQRLGEAKWRRGFGIASKTFPIEQSTDVLTLALRIEINIRYGPRPALRPGTLTLGDTATLQRYQAEKSSSLAVSHIPEMVNVTLEFALAFVLLAYCLLTRRSTDYLWFTAFLVIDGTGTLISVYRSVIVGGDDVSSVLKIFDALGYIGRYIPLTEFLYRFAGKPIPWLARIYQSLLVVAILLLVFNPILFYSIHGLALSFLPFDLFAPYLLFRWWRAGNHEAGLLLIPVALANVWQIIDSALISSHNVYAGFFIGPLHVYLDVLVVFLFLGAIIPILLSRATRVEREHARTTGELEAARRVQELLLPPRPPTMPGFAVETVYLPATEVGGDFFHLSPGADGSLLAVVGDVSGKGLRAAMEVSAVMGALRNEPSRSPAVILAHLNAMLCGYMEGFVTCSAALLRADGTARLANAGNPAPYRDGTEVDVTPSLPLGITLDATFEESTTTLAPNQRLVFCSDGVIEATKPGTRELFGFERTAALSTQPAIEIAETAQRFGQEDDISVVSIQRL